ncbi:MAG TPA: Spy/CpxP family protein refolding chaperone [Burkholderiales bacterium]|nr:Spy/CpxP family protein refolding chaperone [Burkholderiales bacterium]
MTLKSNSFDFAGVRNLAAAALVSVLAFSSANGVAAGTDPHQASTNARIQAMHDKLKITPAEEALWNKMAQVMREDAKTMDALIQARVDHSQSMNAVEDLESYSRITEARAEGAKKLIPVFSALYASMSPAQKHEADTMFRNSDKQHAVQKPKQ